MKAALAALLAASFVLAVQPAHARRTLSVKSVEPATTVLRNGRADITLVIHAAGTDQCTAIVTIDGERPRSLKFGSGNPDTQTLRITLRNTGRYIIDIGPRPGSTDCTKTQAVVSVHEDKPAAAKPAAAKPTIAVAPGPAITQPLAAPKGPSAKDRMAAACPDGWSMATNDGTRFTCRLIPPRALTCPEGTKYFSKGVEIGCR